MKSLAKLCFLSLSLLCFAGNDAHAQTYCRAYATPRSTAFISRVVVNDLDKSSGIGGSGRYENFTSLSASLRQGAAAAFELHPGFSKASYKLNWAIFIDYNHDGFNNLDNTEKVASGVTTGKGPLYGSFTVPANVPVGKTRMRVVMRRAPDVPRPCGDVLMGAVEDYGAEIAEQRYQAAPPRYLGTDAASLITDFTRNKIYGAKGNGFYIIDAKTEAQSAIYLNKTIYNIALSKDRSFVAAAVGDDIAVIDLSTFTVKMLKLYQGAQTVAIDAKQIIYYANTARDWSSVGYATKDGRFINALRDSKGNVAQFYSPWLRTDNSGTTLFIAERELGPAKMTKYNVASSLPVLSLVSSEHFGTGIKDFTISPNGKNLYLSLYGAAAKLDATTLTRLSTYDGGYNDYYGGIAIDSAESKVCFALGRYPGKVQCYNPATGERKISQPFSQYSLLPPDQSVALSPDGKKIFATMIQPVCLAPYYCVNRSGLNVIDLIDLP